MQIGLICPGRMGNNIKRLLRKHGHSSVVFNCSCTEVEPELEEKLEPSTQVVFSLDELVQTLEKPRIVWSLGQTSDTFAEMIDRLIHLLEPGDIVIDSKNAYCQGSDRCAERLGQHGIHYVDVGTSTGCWNVKRGYCLMIGGEPDVVSYLEPIFAALTPPSKSKQSAPKSHKSNLKSKRSKVKPAVSHFYCGSAGAGHFARQFYDGVEETLMRAYAEVLAERDRSPEPTSPSSSSSPALKH